MRMGKGEEKDLVEKRLEREDRNERTRKGRRGAKIKVMEK